MRDPRTNVYNFDQRIRRLPHPDEIDLQRFPAYVTASKDKVRPSGSLVPSCRVEKS